MVFSYIQMMCALGSNHHELYPTDEKNVHYFAKLFTIHSTSYHSFELFECNELQEFQSLQDSHQGQILLKTNEGPIFHLPNKLPPIKSCYVNVILISQSLQKWCKWSVCLAQLLRIYLNHSYIMNLQYPDLHCCVIFLTIISCSAVANGEFTELLSITHQNVMLSYTVH